jgi:hypothetical protein
MQKTSSTPSTLRRREAGGGREPSPLPTPEVSKHGTNEAWLFIKDQQRETAGTPPLRLMNSGLSERSSGNVGAESDGGSTSGPSNSRGGSGRRGGSMHRSASVVSFRGDDGSEGSLHDVHCIGSVNELKKEKKGKRSSTFKWLKKEASALAYEYGLKKKQGTCLDVDKKLKESRRNMVDNLDDTSVHNAGRRAWETRDVSLRGGGDFFKLRRRCRRRCGGPRRRPSCTGWWGSATRTTTGARRCRYPTGWSVSPGKINISRTVILGRRRTRVVCKSYSATS